MRKLTQVLKDYGVKLRSADGNIIGASDSS